MEQILSRVRAMRLEMDGLIGQMEALGIKEAGDAVAAPKKVGRPKKVVAVAAPSTAVEKVDGRKRPMTEEHKAKMKAGREAKKAIKAAEKAAAEAAAAAGGKDDDVIFEEDEEKVEEEEFVEEVHPKPRRICRKCVVNLKYGTDHRRCFFGGLQEGLWASSNEWEKDCEEFAKRFAPEE